MSDNNRNTVPNQSNDNSSEKNNSDPPVPEKVSDSNINTCIICLEVLTNRSTTDSCFHDFCFECLWLWSQTHNICPLCRHPYNNILANIDSEPDFTLISLVNHQYHPQNTSIQIRGQIQHLLRGQHQMEVQQRNYQSLMSTLNRLDVNSTQYLQQLETLSLLADELSDTRTEVSNIRTNIRNIVLSHLNNQRNRTIAANSVPTNQQNLNPGLPQPQPPVPQDQQQNQDSDDESDNSDEIY